RTAKQGPKSRPCRAETLRVLSPHAKQVRPIEQLAPASPTVQVLGWQGKRERAELAPQGPRGAGLSRWAGADLTAAELAPAGPSVQALSRWAEADLTAGQLAPPGPSGQGLALWDEADLAEAGGTSDSEGPVAGQPADQAPSPAPLTESRWCQPRRPGLNVQCEVPPDWHGVGVREVSRKAAQTSVRAAFHQTVGVRTGRWPGPAGPSRRGCRLGRRGRRGRPGGFGPCRGLGRSCGGRR
ncbi:hypothetical protein LV75_002411, partial [Actinokineospora diospyrosa]|nr:hypothetical protein [Actinokineospora diospyrosa]